MIMKLANPKRFSDLARRLLPWMTGVAVLAMAAGLYQALIASPPDYQQGETVRIMYIHVPAAIMAMGIYVSMACAAIVGLVWKHIVAELYPRAVAPVGAAFTFICLATGSLWGKPMWGTWWVWDARLTSVLILFFLYLGYIALVDAFDDAHKGIKAGAALLIVGLINIPIIKFSVEWWNTLHQPASLLRMDGPSIDSTMMLPLTLMIIAFAALFTVLALARTLTAIAARRAAVEAAR